MESHFDVDLVLYFWNSEHFRRSYSFTLDNDTVPTVVAPGRRNL